MKTTKDIFFFHCRFRLVKRALPPFHSSHSISERGAQAVTVLHRERGVEWSKRWGEEGKRPWSSSCSAQPRAERCREQQGGEQSCPLLQHSPGDGGWMEPAWSDGGVGGAGSERGAPRAHNSGWNF